MIENLGLHEVNFSYPNYLPEPSNGFRIVELTKNQAVYIPQVVGATLSARLASNPSQVLTGSALEDAQFVIENSTGAKYVLKIKTVSSVAYWAKPGGVTKYTPYYVIEWAVDDGGAQHATWTNLCAGPPPEFGVDTLNLPTFAVVLFENDRIDAKKKEVVGLDSGWVNLGCAGHTLSKLHLTGHSEGAQVATKNDAQRFATTRAERTAVIKMLVSDYCATGDAFTIAGQPLSWIDSKQWMAYWDVPKTSYEIEARWTSRGASCLTEPRVLANPSPEAAEWFDDVKAAIATACGGQLPPPCPGKLDNLDGHHLVSANPVL